MLFHQEETMHMSIFPSYCLWVACWCCGVQYEPHLMKHPLDKCHVHHRMATLWWSLLPWSAEEDCQKSLHLHSTCESWKNILTVRRKCTEYWCEGECCISVLILTDFFLMSTVMPNYWWSLSLEFFKVVLASLHVTCGCLPELRYMLSWVFSKPWATLFWAVAINRPTPAIASVISFIFAFIVIMNTLNT